MGNYNPNCFDNGCYQNCCNYYGYCPSSTSSLINYNYCYYYYTYWAWWGWFVLSLGIFFVLLILGGLTGCCVRRRRMRMQQTVIIDVNSPSYGNNGYNNQYNGYSNGYANGYNDGYPNQGYANQLPYDPNANQNAVPLNYQTNQIYMGQPVGPQQYK